MTMISKYWRSFGRKLRYFDYYLEAAGKRLSGRGGKNPAKNGEFKLLAAIIKNSGQTVSFVDGGAHVGGHSIEFLRLCDKYHKTPLLTAIEPFPNTARQLRQNLADTSGQVIECALGRESEAVDFYCDHVSGTSTTNSVFNQYFQRERITVQQLSLDAIF